MFVHYTPNSIRAVDLGWAHNINPQSCVNKLFGQLSHSDAAERWINGRCMDDDDDHVCVVHKNTLPVERRSYGSTVHHVTCFGTWITLNESKQSYLEPYNIDHRPYEVIFTSATESKQGVRKDVCRFQTNHLRNPASALGLLIQHDQHGFH